MSNDNGGVLFVGRVSKSTWLGDRQRRRKRNEGKRGIAGSFAIVPRRYCSACRRHELRLLHISSASWDPSWYPSIVTVTRILAILYLLFAYHRLKRVGYFSFFFFFHFSFANEKFLSFTFIFFFHLFLQYRQLWIHNKKKKMLIVISECWLLFTVVEQKVIEFGDSV